MHDYLTVESILGSTCEEMMKRAIFFRGFRVSIVMHDYLTVESI